MTKSKDHEQLDACDKALEEAGARLGVTRAPGEQQVNPTDILAIINAVRDIIAWLRNR